MKPITVALSAAIIVSGCGKDETAELAFATLKEVVREYQYNALTYRTVYTATLDRRSIETMSQGAFFIKIDQCESAYLDIIPLSISYQNQSLEGQPSFLPVLTFVCRQSQPPRELRAFKISKTP